MADGEIEAFLTRMGDLRARIGLRDLLIARGAYWDGATPQPPKGVTDPSHVTDVTKEVTELRSQVTSVTAECDRLRAENTELHTHINRLANATLKEAEAETRLSALSTPSQRLNRRLTSAEKMRRLREKQRLKAQAQEEIAK